MVNLMLRIIDVHLICSMIWNIFVLISFMADHTYSTRSKAGKATMVVHPRMRPLPFKDLNETQGKRDLRPVVEINGIQFYQWEDLPLNKRGYKYKPCQPDTNFPANLYSTTEYPPYGVRALYFDRLAAILFDSSAQSVTTSQGWRSVRANAAIREGTWFFEFEIVKANESSSNCHVRVGLGRREASLEAPIGFDGYGYGLRDVCGEHMTLSRPQGIYVPGGFRTGDVIGLKVELPPISEHQTFVNEWKSSKESAKTHTTKKSRLKKMDVSAVRDEQFRAYDNVLRDQVPIKYKNALYYEQYDYTTHKVMDHLLNPVAIFGEKAVLEESDVVDDLVPRIPGSKITIFKNGVETEHKIEGLFLFLEGAMVQAQNPNYRGTDDGSLGYYPTMLVFGGGVVRLNPGPHFNHPVPGVRSLSELYNEQVVLEWYWDLVDEMEAEYLDMLESKKEQGEEFN